MRKKIITGALIILISVNVISYFILNMVTREDNINEIGIDTWPGKGNPGNIEGFNVAYPNDQFIITTAILLVLLIFPKILYIFLNKKKSK